LAVFVVFLFLGDGRPTFITALAIPTSIIATFTFMKMLGFTINNMSLMGLSLAVGFLIDDAIVVIENLYRHIQMGKTAIQAAIDAAGQGQTIKLQDGIYTGSGNCDVSFRGKALTVRSQSRDPDVCIVQVHRDPVATISSFCSLAATVRRSNSTRVDPTELGPRWTEHWADGCDRAMAARDRAPATASLIDVSYEDLIAAPHDVVDRILDEIAPDAPRPRRRSQPSPAPSPSRART